MHTNLDPLLQRIAEHFGLDVLKSWEQGYWYVFEHDIAVFKGRIPESLTLAEAAERLKSMSEEMGSLYALADEAGCQSTQTGIR